MAQMGSRPKPRARVEPPIKGLGRTPIPGAPGGPPRPGSSARAPTCFQWRPHRHRDRCGRAPARRPGRAPRERSEGRTAKDKPGRAHARAGGKHTQGQHAHHPPTQRRTTQGCGMVANCARGDQGPQKRPTAINHPWKWSTTVDRFQSCWRRPGKCPPIMTPRPVRLTGSLPSKSPSNLPTCDIWPDLAIPASTCAMRPTQRC